MALDPVGLEVYQVAREWLELIDESVEQLPRGHGHLANQLTRAGLSVVDNIADSAGQS